MKDEAGKARIHRLDSLTVNQIAAGEVIERPVSVVKELVENSLDAGSTRIQVEIREGGLESIQVTDNGAGISGDDLPLAVERHATSKLERIGDLENLGTLGFRGEALASICSVAALEIVTRRPEDLQGCRLLVRGEEQEPVIGAAGCPAGTRITVEHLFFNTPARLKFMKTPGYEGGLIHDLLIQMALGYPEIEFRLASQGRTILDTAGINRLPDLIELFYGKEARSSLVSAAAPISQSFLQGQITAPPYSRGTRKGMHVFVNGRRISIRELQWPIERAFEFLLPRGRFPVAVLHLEIPGSLLDVNVHPGKLEVRINDKGLSAGLTRALREALSGGRRLPDAGDLGSVCGGADTEKSAPAGGPGAAFPARTAGPAPAQGWRQNAGCPPQKMQIRQWEELYSFTGQGEEELTGLLAEPAAGGPDPGENAAGPETSGGEESGIEKGTLPEAEQSLFEQIEHLGDRSPGETRNQWGTAVHTRTLQQLISSGRPEDFCFGPDISFRIIGQLHDTFILAEVEAGLLVVDQHVAHERILYERMLAREAAEAAGPRPAQLLALPISVSLTSLEEEILIKNILTLNDLGLILERFGPREYLIRSLPAGESSLDPDMFKDLLADLAAAGGQTEISKVRQRLLVMMSCKQAVKANTPLSEGEMRALLTGLQRTRHPMTCPHGRPILYLLPFSRLLRAFGRSL